jgi:hypothetical protein
MHDGWIVPKSPEMRDAHPFRNKIGELWQLEPLAFDRDQIGWGYRWYDPGLKSVVRVWVEESLVWSREGGEMDGVREEEPTGEQVRKMYDECVVDYGAFGQSLPGNAWFDGDFLDLVSDEEDGEGGFGSDGRVENDYGGDYREEDDFGEDDQDEDYLIEDDREDYVREDYDEEYELRKLY